MLNRKLRTKYLKNKGELKFVYNLSQQLEAVITNRSYATNIDGHLNTVCDGSDGWQYTQMCRQNGLLLNPHLVVNL